MGLPNTFFYLAVLRLVLGIDRASSQRCAQGSFRDSGVCKLCRAGTYSNSINSASCQRCPPGTYYPFRGGKSPANCLRCPSETFSTSRGAVSERACKACPPGTHSQGGAARCLKCRKGFGMSVFEQTQCERCQPGSFNDGTTKFCRLCPGGTLANLRDGATKCVACAAGTFRDLLYQSDSAGGAGSSRCADCPRNTFASTLRSKQCKPCRPGTVADKGSTTCTPCPSDTFRSSVRDARCAPCAAGTTSKPRSEGCKHATKGCPFGTFEDARGACRACLTGERLDRAARKCILCGANEVSMGGDTTTCTKCERGKEPTTAAGLFERAHCVCALGTKQENDGSCSPCPSGTRGVARVLMKHPVATRRRASLTSARRYARIARWAAARHQVRHVAHHVVLVRSAPPHSTLRTRLSARSSSVQRSAGSVRQASSRTLRCRPR